MPSAKMILKYRKKKVTKNTARENATVIIERYYRAVRTIQLGEEEQLHIGDQIGSEKGGNAGNVTISDAGGAKNTTPNSMYIT